MELLFVTGASSGIGAAMADAAARDGATIASISRRSGPGIFLAADLSLQESWPGVIEWIGATIDEVAPDWVGLAHCAGTLEPIGPVTDVDIGAYSRNVVLNSAAPQVLGAAVLAALARRGIPGTVLQISSGAATTVYPGWSSYSAAKAALEHWVRTVGQELGPEHKVMAIAPGVVATDMQQKIRDTSSDRFPKVEKFRELHESGGLADPAEVGERLWALMRSTEIDSGAVVDLRHM